MNNSKHYYAVVLAGGGGTRLWPKSRNDTPKQFLKLGGEKTLLQIAAYRISHILPWDRIIVVTNKLYKNEIVKQLPQIPAKNIIAEPEKKDTALAMLVGSLYAKSLDPQAVVMNSASDHVVTNSEEFERVMLFALKIAQQNDYLVTVGISPREPNTGFGYIKAGDDLTNRKSDLSLFRVDSFTEKPNLSTAKAYISTGKYYWNANMYVWSVDSIIRAFEKHMPKMLKLTSKLSNLSYQDFHKALPEIYKKSEKIAVDYAISEKADNLVLIPGDFGWNDVGLWKTVYELGEKNKDQNVVLNDEKNDLTVSIESKNNLIHCNNRLIALLGLENMLVIDTGEILLIAPQERSQDIKKVVDHLQLEKKDCYL